MSSASMRGEHAGRDRAAMPQAIEMRLLEIAEDVVGLVRAARDAHAAAPWPTTASAHPASPMTSPSSPTIAWIAPAVARTAARPGGPHA